MRLSVSSKPVETDSGPIPVTISVGLVAGCPTVGLFKGEELLRAADTALYRAKRNGRNRVERAAEMEPASQARASAAP
jgi:PleD family two-component response regulator